MTEPYVRPTTALESSCVICFGTGIWKGAVEESVCQCRKVEPVEILRRMLMLLTVEQMAFLRRFEHTHAYQPVTGDEWDASCVQFYVEEDDAVIDDNYEHILIPATRYWFASGMAHMGPSHDGVKSWIQYNPTGLALRECLMAGASAACR